MSTGIRDASWLVTGIMLIGFTGGFFSLLSGVSHRLITSLLALALGVSATFVVKLIIARLHRRH